MPLPNPSFEPKTSMVAPRAGGAMSGGALPKLRIFCPKTAFFFGPKWPRNTFKMAKQRETVATRQVRLDLPVTKSPLLPSISTICPRNGPKNGSKCAQFVSNSPKSKNGLYLWLRGSNPKSEGTKSTCNPPLLGVPKP